MKSTKPLWSLKLDEIDSSITMDEHTSCAVKFLRSDCVRNMPDLKQVLKMAKEQKITNRLRLIIAMVSMTKYSVIVKMLTMEFIATHIDLCDDIPYVHDCIIEMRAIKDRIVAKFT